MTPAEIVLASCVALFWLVIAVALWRGIRRERAAAKQLDRETKQMREDFDRWQDWPPRLP